MCCASARPTDEYAYMNRAQIRHAQFATHNLTRTIRHAQFDTHNSPRTIRHTQFDTHNSTHTILQGQPSEASEKQAINTQTPPTTQCRRRTGPLCRLWFKQHQTKRIYVLAHAQKHEHARRQHEHARHAHTQQKTAGHPAAAPRRVRSIPSSAPFFSGGLLERVNEVNGGKPCQVGWRWKLQSKKKIQLSPYLQS